MPDLDKRQRHDQSAIYVSNDGTLHILGRDLTPSLKDFREQSAIYGQSSDGLRTCSGEQRPGSIGELAEITGTVEGILIVGPGGYFRSADNGHSFSAKIPYRFADKMARIAVGLDRRTAYVVGDAAQGGLWMQATEDGGKTWRRARIDTASAASAWRYPAVTVSQAGRVHVVWMDDRDGHGAVYHAYSDDGGRTFSENARVSDRPFYFPADAPPPPPATQNGTWIGDYMSLTVVHDKVVAAWSDQRAGLGLSAVYAAAGAP
jgi:hypothetical protein